jgi:hypothetical protein
MTAEDTCMGNEVTGPAGQAGNCDRVLNPLSSAGVAGLEENAGKAARNAER